MARKRKRRQRPDDWWDEDEFRRRRRDRHERRSEPAAVAVLEPPKPRPVTCYQCQHLLVTRSIVKLIHQSWDRAISYPTLSCFQQKWTLEDPDSVADPSAVSEYLVGGAENCPDFQRGYPRDHRW